MTDLYTTIESLTSSQVNELVKPIYPKVETLGQILHIDMTLEDSTSRVLNHARVFYSLWVAAEDDLENTVLKDSCIKLLQSLANETITDMRDVLSLSKEIMDELSVKIKSVS